MNPSLGPAAEFDDPEQRIRELLERAPAWHAAVLRAQPVDVDEMLRGYRDLVVEATAVQATIENWDDILDNPAGTVVPLRDLQERCATKDVKLEKVESALKRTSWPPDPSAVKLADACMALAKRIIRPTWKGLAGGLAGVVLGTGVDGAVGAGVVQDVALATTTVGEILWEVGTVGVVASGVATLPRLGLLVAGIVHEVRTEWLEDDKAELSRELEADAEVLEQEWDRLIALRGRLTVAIKHIEFAYGGTLADPERALAVDEQLRMAQQSHLGPPPEDQAGTMWQEWAHLVTLGTALGRLTDEWSRVFEVPLYEQDRLHEYVKGHKLAGHHEALVHEQSQALSGQESFLRALVEQGRSDKGPLRDEETLALRAAIMRAYSIGVDQFRAPVLGDVCLALWLPSEGEASALKVPVPTLQKWGSNLGDSLHWMLSGKRSGSVDAATPLSEVGGRPSDRFAGTSTQEGIPRSRGGLE